MKRSEVTGSISRPGLTVFTDRHSQLISSSNSETRPKSHVSRHDSSNAALLKLTVAARHDFMVLSRGNAECEQQQVCHACCHS